MAEDNAATTARYLADKVSTQLMLRYLFELLGSLDDDPDAFRASAKKQMVDLAKTVPLGPMSPKMEKDVRAYASETIDNLLTNKPPN
jgi:hypothetical protein